MFEQFVKYIGRTYRGSKKIVEVGVGHRIDIAIMIALLIPEAEMIITDKDEKWVRSRKTRRVRAVADDVMFPSVPIYEGARLIYSLHPPLELVRFLDELADKVGSDLIVVPTYDEREAFRTGWKSINIEGRVLGFLRQKKPA